MWSVCLTLIAACTHHGVRGGVIVLTTILIVALLAGPNKEFFTSYALLDVSMTKVKTQSFIPYGHSRNSHVLHQ
jgi:hypothetical protein